MSVPMPSSTRAVQPTLQPEALDKQSHIFHVSPELLHLSDCPWAVPPVLPHSPEALIEVHLSRLETVWRNAKQTALPSQVKCTGERVCRTLAKDGILLAHLAAKVLDIPNGKNRIEVSVLWLVPTPEDDEEIAHRVVAEVLTQLHGHGSHTGEVENVAMRFSSDWEDWTVAQPDEYNRASGTQSLKFAVPQGGEGSSKKVLDEVWEEVRTLLQGECQPSSPELMRRIGRAAAELKRKGKFLTEFEVEKVYRKSSSGKQFNPVIRIAMHAGDAVGAVVLIDTRLEAGKRKVKHIAVAYQGEWPIAHHYRTFIKPPKLDDLKTMVTGKHARLDGDVRNCGEEVTA